MRYEARLGADHGTGGYCGSGAATALGNQGRLAILEEASAPGTCEAKVSRRLDVATSLIYTCWRKILEAHAASAACKPGPDFAEAVMLAGGASVGFTAAPATVIDPGRGRRISVFAAASAAQVAAALKALR